jgi:hypothetical protein
METIESEVKKLGGEYDSVSVDFAFHFGGGFKKKLTVKTHFCGNETDVEFIVTDHGEEVSYYLFDDAVEAYNAIKRREA